MLIKAKIPSNSVEIGMFVVELDRPWIDVPLMFQRFIVKNDHELLTLRKYCKCVFIEVEEKYWLANKSRLLGTYSVSKLPENTPLHSELPRAQSTYFNAREHAIKIMDTLRADGKLDIDESRRVIRNCLTSILSNANALFWLTRVKDKHQFTAEHSLRVAILSIALGKFLGIDNQQLELLGLCGMLHDLGKTQIPEDILDKPGLLSNVEKRVMQRHTVLGFELINSDHTIDSAIKDVILNHHKRMDGNGYPKQKVGESLSVYCRIVSIIDAYDIITSDTPYKQGLSPREALKELFNERDRQFDGKLVEAFIKMIGIYPAGSLVEMSNGEIGLIVSTDPEKKLNPKVELIRDQLGMLRKPTVIDLTQSPHDSQGQPYFIKTALPDGALGIDMRQYIQQKHQID
ncbi:MAG: HD-GYP domain-containing protein [Kangiellaceae bacterium]|nr:HD-GYP domain-containing protein [Kangiellaceae bacterium]